MAHPLVYTQASDGEELADLQVGLKSFKLLEVLFGELAQIDFKRIHAVVAASTGGQGTPFSPKNMCPAHSFSGIGLFHVQGIVPFHCRKISEMLFNVMVVRASIIGAGTAEHPANAPPHVRLPQQPDPRAATVPTNHGVPTPHFDRAKRLSSRMSNDAGASVPGCLTDGTAPHHSRAGAGAGAGAGVAGTAYNPDAGGAVDQARQREGEVEVEGAGEGEGRYQMREAGEAAGVVDGPAHLLHPQSVDGSVLSNMAAEDDHGSHGDTDTHGGGTNNNSISTPRADAGKAENEFGLSGAYSSFDLSAAGGADDTSLPGNRGTGTGMDSPGMPDNHANLDTTDYGVASTPDHQSNSRDATTFDTPLTLSETQDYHDYQHTPASAPLVHRRYPDTPGPANHLANHTPQNNATPRRYPQDGVSLINRNASLLRDSANNPHAHILWPFCPQ